MICLFVRTSRVRKTEISLEYIFDLTPLADEESRRRIIIHETPNLLR